jgi:hypothetical protein
VLRFLSSLVFASALLAPVLCGERLAAASVVTTKSGGFAAVAEERLAFSTNAERTVSFEQLRLDSASGEIAWLVPVPAGATLEIGHADFFVSLDLATAPVLTPASGLSCGNDMVSTAAAHEEPLPEKPLSTMIVDGSKAAGLLSAAGYEVSAALRAQLLDVEKMGERVAILEILPGASTPLLRVIGPAGRAMPTSLLSPSLAKLSGYVIGEHRVRLETGSTLQLEFERVRWDRSGISFGSLLDQTLFAANDGIVVTFASSKGLLTAQPLSSTSALPSVAERYLTAPECVARAMASATSASKVSTAPGSGELAEATFACGTRLDLAAALVGLAPNAAWITRFEGIDPGIDGKLRDDGNVALPSLHQVVLGGCTDGSPQPSGPGPGSPSGGGGGGGYDDDGTGAASAAADACVIGLDACSRSSGDSSSGDGCGGDSSSSGDGCGGDSGSSSDGCGGSSGSSGDSCSSGTHTSSADDGCRIGYRARRVRLSPIVLGLVAVATILRRRGRRAV